MEAEFGLLKGTQVAELLGSRTPNRNVASQYRIEGRIIGVKRGRAYVYPGFQFDADTASVKPVIRKLSALARANQWSDESLALWMCSLTGYLDDMRPVDRLAYADDVLAAARAKFETEW